jgi:hypothetical protein
MNWGRWKGRVILWFLEWWAMARVGVSGSQSAAISHGLHHCLYHRGGDQFGSSNPPEVCYLPSHKIETIRGGPG